MEPPKDFQLPLKNRFSVAEETMAFVFDTHGTDFTFRAGQNADYTIENPPFTDAEGNTRTFSFASSPSNRDEFLIATRMRPTAFKRSLRDLPLGTKIRVTSVGGRMALPDDPSVPVVLIAGGIGITPFRSMIEWAFHERREQRIHLLYSNRTPAATAFLTDLESWAKQWEHFQFTATIAEADPTWPYERGRIDADFLKRHVPDFATPQFFLAGPPRMVAAMSKLLQELGVSVHRIALESFSGYP